MAAPGVCIRHGRVVDPASGSERLADVTIREGRVESVGAVASPDPGSIEIDATGLIVGPGFIDLHSHVNSVAGQRLQALDGVTTTLDLEAGLMPLEVAYRRAAAAGRPLNYGFSASWAGARAAVLAGHEPDADLLSMLAVLENPDWQRSSSGAERARWLDRLEQELHAGGLGIGVLLGYAPRTEPGEFLAVADLAAQHSAPVFTHVRELVEVDPSTPIDGSEEIIRAASETGASMHHCHVNSTSRRHVDRVLRLIERSQRAGSRITVEAYPYGAGSTAIGAFFLDPDRLGRWQMKPSDLVMLASGERVRDAEHLRHLRAADPGAPCIVEFLDESDTADMEFVWRGLEYPDAIVASDAMPVIWPDGTAESHDWPLPPGGRTHPRTAGTYAKSLRTMVRERRTWSWVEAFRRCSFLPARVLDEVAPAMRDRGRLEPGAVADIVVLDPERLTDQATFADSTRQSLGVEHLLVNGHPVVRSGDLLSDSYPGQAIRRGIT